MSFLGGLFGLKPADKGKVLGSKATPSAAASEASKEFDVTFTEQVSPGMNEYCKRPCSSQLIPQHHGVYSVQSLGMVVECLELDLRPIVESVTPGGPADRSGIRAGE